MYVRMAWRRLKLGAWDQFEGFYREKLSPATRDFPALQHRQLWRSTEDSDEGISVSLWDNEEAMQDYEDSELRRELAGGMEATISLRLGSRCQCPGRPLPLSAAPGGWRRSPGTRTSHSL
jgi:heme-degrading monooxygenase HmoA